MEEPLSVGKDRGHESFGLLVIPQCFVLRHKSSILRWTQACLVFLID